MLVDGTGSTSTTSAATANSVKTLWDSIVGKLTGSGTVNYIPKFNSTGSVANSQIFDDGTYVGVGTPTPTEKFEVAGNIKLSGGVPTYRITNLASPIGNDDAANKGYVDTKVSAAGSAVSNSYLSNGSYYSEGGSPYFCKLNTLAGTVQKITPVNQNQLCDTASNLYCNAGLCNASASTIASIRSSNQLVSAKDDKSCSVNNGQVYCWGYTGNGQKYLGLSLAGVNDSGNGHTCALL